LGAVFTHRHAHERSLDQTGSETPCRRFVHKKHEKGVKVSAMYGQIRKAIVAGNDLGWLFLPGFARRRHNAARVSPDVYRCLHSAGFLRSDERNVQAERLATVALHRLCRWFCLGQGYG
jgi:hypothetical protein